MEQLVNKSLVTVQYPAASARENLLAVSTDLLEIAAMSQAMDQLTEALGEVERDKIMAN